MIVSCLENYRESLIKGKDYLVIEIYTNVRTQKISYRVCDEQGVLAIYNHNLFEVKNPSLNKYAIKINSLNTKIMIDRLLELDKSSMNLEGLWGDYFDGDKEKISNVHQVIREHAKFEGIIIPEPTAY